MNAPREKMPWYVKAFAAVALLVAACLATGCGGSVYLDDRHGDVGVCVGFSLGGDDGEVSEDNESR